MSRSLWTITRDTSGRVVPAETKQTARLPSHRTWESIVQNYFLIETETKHRQREWQRAVAADARFAQARPAQERERWSHLRRLVLTILRARSPSRLPRAPWWNSAAGERATTAEGGGATVM